MKKFEKEIALLYKVNSADINALEDAKTTLIEIKEKFEEYQEMIDITLHLIEKALDTGVNYIEAVEKIEEELEVQA